MSIPTTCTICEKPYKEFHGDDADDPKRMCPDCFEAVFHNKDCTCSRCVLRREKRSNTV